MLKLRTISKQELEQGEGLDLSEDVRETAFALCVIQGKVSLEEIIKAVNTADVALIKGAMDYWVEEGRFRKLPSTCGGVLHQQYIRK